MGGATNHGYLSVGMLDKGRNRETNDLLREAGPTSEDTVVRPRLGMAEFSGICRRPVHELLGFVDWPENGNYWTELIDSQLNVKVVSALLGSMQSKIGNAPREPS